MKISRTSLIAPAVIALFGCLIQDTAKAQNNVKTIILNDGKASIEIKQLGQVMFTDDETAVKSIVPAGYITYKKNNIKITARSNSRGDINYEVFDGSNKLIDESSRQAVAKAVKDMINAGIDRTGRAERLYAKGGVDLVINEIANASGDLAKGYYFDWLLTKKTLSEAELTEVVKQVGMLLTSDLEKLAQLNKVTEQILKNSGIAQAYLSSVKTISVNSERAKMLRNLINNGQLTAHNIDTAISICSGIQGDSEKAGIIKLLINKGEKTEEQWVGLINSIAAVSSEVVKGNILISMAGKMPKTEKIKSAYMEVAKTITSSSEQAKVTKAIN